MKVHRNLLSLIVLVLLAGLLAGCGTPEEPAAPTQVVVEPTTVVEATEPPEPAAPTEVVVEPTEETVEAATVEPTAVPEPVEEPQKVVEELVIVQEAEIPTLDAQLNWTMVGRNIYYQLFGYLTRHDENMVVVPELAESWEWIDELTMRWHLRSGVTFHNGEPFNAEAMKFSLERILNEETGAPWRAVLTWIDRIEVVDEYTVDVIGQFPTTSQLLEVGRMPMVPPMYVEEVGAEFFAENPVSAGPWKFVEWIKGDRVVLERNMDYWSGPPPIERLVFRVVPESTTALAELQAGTVDIAKISPESCEPLDASGVAHCVSARSIQNVQISFLNDTDDINLRKAIAHAINVDNIIEYIMGGRAVRSVGPMSLLVWGSNPDLTGYEYNPDLSKQFLAEGGYVEGEVKIPLNFAEGRVPKGREIAEAIAGDLAAVGIEVELMPTEYGVWFDAMYGGTLSGITLSASTATTGDPNQMFRDYLMSSCIGYYCSEELDSYLVPVKEVVEPDARLPLVRAAEEFVMEQVYWVTLFDVDLIYGVSNKVDWAPVPNDLKWILSATPR